MKTIGTTLAVFVAMALVGCGQRERGRKTQMLLDSAPSGDNVTIVRPKEPARPDENITDLKGLRTIMQTDIDAAQRTPSKEVVYVKPGEPNRPAETRR